MSLVAYDFVRNLWSYRNITIRNLIFYCLIFLFFSLFKSNNRLLGFLGGDQVVVKCGRYILSFHLYVILQLFELKVAIFEEFRELMSSGKELQVLLNGFWEVRLNLGKIEKNCNFRPFIQVSRAHLGISTSDDLAFFWVFQQAH
jgi:hypothetical protein